MLELQHVTVLLGIHVVIGEIHDQAYRQEDQIKAARKGMKGTRLFSVHSSPPSPPLCPFPSPSMTQRIADEHTPRYDGEVINTSPRCVSWKRKKIVKRVMLLKGTFAAIVVGVGLSLFSLFAMRECDNFTIPDQTGKVMIVTGGNSGTVLSSISPRLYLITPVT